MFRHRKTQQINQISGNFCTMHGPDISGGREDIKSEAFYLGGNIIYNNDFFLSAMQPIGCVFPRIPCSTLGTQLLQSVKKKKRERGTHDTTCKALRFRSWFWDIACVCCCLARDYRSDVSLAVSWLFGQRQRSILAAQHQNNVPHGRAVLAVLLHAKQGYLNASHYLSRSRFTPEQGIDKLNQSSTIPKVPHLRKRELFQVTVNGISVIILINLSLSKSILLF